MAEQLNGNQIPDNEYQEFPESTNLDSTKPDYEEIHPEPGTTALPPPPDYAEIEGARNTSNNWLPPPNPGDLKSFGGSPPSYAAVYTIAGDIRGMTPSYWPPTFPNNQGASPHVNIPPQPVNNMYPGFTPPMHYPEQDPVFVQPRPVVTIVASEPQCYYSNYLPWSIANILCCCLAFGVVALIFSIQTQSAVQINDSQSASRNSRLALIFNIIATVVGVIIIIAFCAVYFS